MAKTLHEPESGAIEIPRRANAQGKNHLLEAKWKWIAYQQIQETRKPTSSHPAKSERPCLSGSFSRSVRGRRTQLPRWLRSGMAAFSSSLLQSRSNAGDTVEWTFSSSGHSSTSGTPGQPSGFWDSGILNQGATFSHTFPAAGSFPYFCSPHGFVAEWSAR